MIEVLDTITDQLWDERYWLLAQKANNPVEAYQEMNRNAQSAKDTPNIEELPPEQQKWLRATG